MKPALRAPGSFQPRLFPAMRGLLQQDMRESAPLEASVRQLRAVVAG